MHTLATVILEHTTTDGVHHDWLVEDPSLPDPHAPDARLWTVRLLPPPHLWASTGRFEMTLTAPHRRHYLTYQGPVSDNRGRVRQIDRGTAQAQLWSAGRIILGVQFNGFVGEIDARLTGGDQWLAVAGPCRHTTSG